jgi:hypothetical protein
LQYTLSVALVICAAVVPADIQVAQRPRVHRRRRAGNMRVTRQRRLLRADTAAHQRQQACRQRPSAPQPYRAKPAVQMLFLQTVLFRTILHSFSAISVSENYFYRVVPV